MKPRPEGIVHNISNVCLGPVLLLSLSLSFVLFGWLICLVVCKTTLAIFIWCNHGAFRVFIIFFFVVVYFCLLFFSFVSFGSSEIRS
jgi:hypothetical protein